MVDRLVAVNDADYRLPEPVRQALATEIAGDVSDDTTDIGAAMSQVFGRRIDVDVRDFGAKGDGATDDTSAFTAAIAAVAPSGGNVVIPAGVFVVNQELLLPHGVSMAGSGQRSTKIDARGLPDNAAAIRFGGTTEVNGSALSNMFVLGNPARTTDGIYLGNRTGTVAVSDTVLTNVRVQDFRTGIVARFAWDLVFNNVRVHLTNRPIEWGPQVNSVLFSGAFSAFVTGALLSNCETIKFQRLDVVNQTGTTGYAFDLFQSNVVLDTPYIENLARLALIGRIAEVNPSSLVVVGGRVTGDIVINGRGVGLNVTMPWVVERGGGDPRRLTVSNTLNLYGATRRIRIDPDQGGLIGVQTVTRWTGNTPFPYTPAFGGSSLTVVEKAGYSEVTSPDASQGFLVAGGLEIGAQYVFSYRIRRGGTVAILHGLNSSTHSSQIPTTSPGLDFETVHVPFIADQTGLRILYSGAADVQYISLVKGLRFPEPA